MPKVAVVSVAVLLLLAFTAAVRAQPSEATVQSSPGATGASPGADIAASAGGPGAATPADGPPPPAASGSSPQPELDPSTYSVRLRDLEQGVNELKEQVFRSKARLSLLAETVLQGVVGGAQARIVHENHIGASYKIVRIAYALDGVPVLNRADEQGALPNPRQFQVYDGSVAPGEHTLTVELELRGHGHGVFSYLRAYRFKMTSNHTFSAAEGKVSTLRAVSYEQGGPTTPFEKRPAVHYVHSVAMPGARGEAVPGGK